MHFTSVITQNDLQLRRKRENLKPSFYNCLKETAALTKRDSKVLIIFMAKSYNSKKAAVKKKCNLFQAVILNKTGSALPLCLSICYP